MNMPITASHTPVNTAFWASARYTPRPIISHEMPRPRRAAKRVALLRFPVTFQATARAIRPPSSGKAGIRLNTSSAMLM